MPSIGCRTSPEIQICGLTIIRQTRANRPAWLLFPSHLLVIPKRTVRSTVCLYERIASFLRFDPTAVRSQCPAGRCKVCPLSECGCNAVSRCDLAAFSPRLKSPVSASVRVSHILLADVSLLTARSRDSGWPALAPAWGQRVLVCTVVWANCCAEQRPILIPSMVRPASTATLPSRSYADTIPGRRCQCLFRSTAPTASRQASGRWVPLIVPAGSYCTPRWCGIGSSA